MLFFQQSFFLAMFGVQTVFHNFKLWIGWSFHGVLSRLVLKMFPKLTNLKLFGNRFNKVLLIKLLLISIVFTFLNEKESIKNCQHGILKHNPRLTFEVKAYFVTNIYNWIVDLLHTSSQYGFRRMNLPAESRNIRFFSGDKLLNVFLSVNR